MTSNSIDTGQDQNPPSEEEDTKQTPVQGLLICSRGEAQEDGDGFKHFGSYCRNCFKVHGGDILLHSISFFGAFSDPKNKKKNITTSSVTHPLSDSKKTTTLSATYTIELFVETALFAEYYSLCGSSGYEVFGSFRGTVTTEEDELIVVIFGQPILIPEGQWRTITFMLEGHVPTACLNMKDIQREITVRTKDGGEGRKFEFLHGSSQMPQIFFSIPSSEYE